MSASKNSKQQKTTELTGSKKANNLFEFVELIAICLGIILFIFTFFLRHSVVVGSSMDKTLADGDRLIISNFMYTPEAGDIIVCQITDEQQQSSMKLAPKEAIVKRIIATEGQRVKIENGNVYVDGVVLQEDYKYVNGYDDIQSMEEIVVSKGCVFVLGDHRNNSLDSRYFGEIDERLILGKVVLRIAPFSKFGSVYN